MYIERTKQQDICKNVLKNSSNYCMNSRFQAIFFTKSFLTLENAFQ